jgi:hypothetical protein
MRTLFAITFMLALVASALWAQDTLQLYIYGHPDFGRVEIAASNTGTTQLSESGRTEHAMAAVTGSTDQHCQTRSDGWGLREYGASSTCDRKFAAGAGR